MSSPAGWTGNGWTVTVSSTEMTLTQPPGSVAIPSTGASRLAVRRRWFRWSLHNGGQQLVQLRGITRYEARELARALRRLALAPAIADAVRWQAAAAHLLGQGRTRQRWIPAEAVDAVLAARPEPGLLGRVRAAGCEQLLTAGQLEAAGLLDGPLESAIASTNEQITLSELSSRRLFFDTIEETPLTAEQARAVVCFDNRVQVLAAAGSGKTSVLVARAAYAVSRGFIAGNRILLLAFNKAAAAEMQERVATRFAAGGIDSSGIRTATFHSFGLEVIGQATGTKPRLARWLDQGDDVAMVLRIAGELRDASASFRYRWDLYRLLFANAPADLAANEPDGYDQQTGLAGYRTFAGEVVKSHSERLIADFLYLNGINYVYEQPYDVDVADTTHSQYRPDFYYPDIGAWHEHWALGRDGRPPPEFEGYAEAMAWKRRVHAQHGTTLVESTWANVMFGDGLAELKNELTRLGLTFDWNPGRPIGGRARPVKHKDLARLIRTFMTHVKSNSWTPEDLDRRLAADPVRLGGFRTRLFLELYWQIHSLWDRRLAADGSVDFEDMLAQAAGHLEAGTIDAGYDLILVDEFQDVSRARARLVRGLVRAPGRFLMAVGDDWQSVNRFAGADLSVMTDFETWFGRGHQLTLTTTFRCPQTICDVARAFVSKNPDQFGKPMRSAHQNPGPPVRVIQADDAAGAVASYLDDLSGAIAGGRVPGGCDGPVSVDVLCRYGFERHDVLPRQLPPNLRVTVRTVHSAKGLEADYVVIPGMTAGTYGFPSAIADDPVLELAMPVPETFPHAEERRLLYVALTRARRAVVLITPPQRPSPFAVELLKDPHVTVTRSDGSPVEICPGCGQGTLVERHGRFGPFLGCSAFPACKYTRDAHARPGPGCLLWRDPAAGGGPGRPISLPNDLGPGAQAHAVAGTGVAPAWSGRTLVSPVLPLGEPCRKATCGGRGRASPRRFIVLGQPAVRAIARINDCGSATTRRAIRGGQPDQGLSLIPAGQGGGSRWCGFRQLGGAQYNDP
jgi:DNA helicase-4